MPANWKSKYFVAALAVLAVGLAGCGEGEYDLIIRGGSVLDGSGTAAVVTDVGIRGDRIARVGDLSGAAAGRVIDATGLYVAPGFIDVHSHAGGGLASARTSAAHALLAQGITTAVINPDGGGPIDLVAQRNTLLRDGLGVNAAQLIGHNSVRRRAMGGSHNRAPTAAELEEMKRMTREGMEAGAFGLSTGLFYTPGIYSETAEVVPLARIAAEYDGIHQSHIRDESDYDIGVVASVDEIIQISRESGVTGIVTHIKALGPNVWGDSRQIVENIERARAEGLDIWADQYPYHASATGLSAALIPAWAVASGEGGLAGRLQDPSLASRIRSEVRDNLARRAGADRILFRGSGAIAGRTLQQVADERRLNAVDAAIQLVLAGSPGIISFNMDDADIERFMRQPWTMTSSDGGLPVFGSGSTHPRAYGAFARKLGVYVRDRQVVDLPFAIRSMTGLSAEVFRIADRGFIQPGAFADIVVFDLDRVADPADFENPHQYSEGMVYVLVNGELAIDAGEFTNALAGRVLTRRGPAAGYTRADYRPDEPVEPEDTIGG